MFCAEIPVTTSAFFKNITFFAGSRTIGALNLLPIIATMSQTSWTPILEVKASLTVRTITFADFIGKISIGFPKIFQLCSSLGELLFNLIWDSLSDHHSQGSVDIHVLFSQPKCSQIVLDLSMVFGQPGQVFEIFSIYLIWSKHKFFHQFQVPAFCSSLDSNQFENLPT